MLGPLAKRLQKAAQARTQKEKDARVENLVRRLNWEAVRTTVRALARRLGYQRNRLARRTARALKCLQSALFA